MENHNKALDITPHKSATFSAEHKIREAAEIKNDNGLMTKMSAVDLIAKK